MAKTSGVRRAVAVSAVVHIAIAAVLAGIALWPTKPLATQAGVDTRTDEIVIRVDPIEPIPVVSGQPGETPPRFPPAEDQAEPGRRPHAQPAPSSLPPELLAVIRRAQTPTAIIDPNVTPAAVATVARPLHGAMKPGQTVVYVLDCSGSMGEFGKLAAARATLLATLRLQPDTVRFQIVLYNNSTRVVFLGGLVASTAANIATAEAELSRLESSGRSNHTGAIRTAATYRPDVILVLSDADSLPPVKLPGERPIPVCVARVTPEQVESPKELR